MMGSSAFIAANRFGYGANQTTLDAIGSAPKQWLSEQIKPLQLDKSLWNSTLAFEQLYQFDLAKKQTKKGGMMMSSNAEPVTRKSIVDQARTLVNYGVIQSIRTTDSFQMRLLDFFSNHFSVSYSNLPMIALSPTLEREAIGPNLAGSFEDMLLAVEQHPAMLLYLDNARSIGPNSPVGQRRKGKGLNENLAREILELHTLGVDGGYTQADVTEFAKAITGWSIGALARGESSGFLYRNKAHEPGIRQVMARSYAADGLRQGQQILSDLASHPATARHLCHKLVQHFIADQAPEDMVKHMTSAWLATDGNLSRVLHAMIEHPDAWNPIAQKFKSPRDMYLSACRANGVVETRPDPFRSLLILGQTPFGAGSPAGYKDNQQAWSGPRSFMTRIEWAEHISAQSKVDPVIAAKMVLGPYLSEQTLTQIRRAESKKQGWVLLLMSPEFQQR